MMGCGCKGGQSSRTAAAICSACRFGSDSTGGKCAKSGQALMLHVKGVPCPIRRHPDHLGRVRWLGLLWYGLPYPLRLWRWSKARDERWFGLPGCGCIVAIKDAFDRAKAQPRRNDEEPKTT